MRFAARRPYNGGNAPGTAGEDHVAQGFQGKTGMLHVDKKEIEAGLCEEEGDSRASDFRHHGTKNDLPLSQGAFHFVLEDHARFPFSGTDRLSSRHGIEGKDQLKNLPPLMSSVTPVM